MKSFIKLLVPVTVAGFILSSCAEIQRRVDETVGNITNTVNEVDSIIIQEVEEVTNLDSLRILESERVKKIDSLFETTTSAIDSVAGQKREILRELVN